MALPTIDPTLELSCPGMYPFMDGATQRIRDFSGYNRHGTPQNFAGTDVEYVDDWPGQAIAISTPKYVNHGQILDYTVSDFSFEIVVRFNSLANDPMLFDKDPGTGAAGYYISALANGRMEVLTGQAGPAFQVTRTNVGDITLLINHHLIVTRSGTRCRCYKNGTELGYSVVGVHINPATSAANFQVGRYGAGAGLDLNGYISRYNSWSRALGAAEVYERYINAFRL